MLDEYARARRQRPLEAQFTRKEADRPADDQAELQRQRATQRIRFKMQAPRQTRRRAQLQEAFDEGGGIRGSAH
eukprot:2779100-Pyramimonas_sp.AAC.1